MPLSCLLPRDTKRNGTDVRATARTVSVTSSSPEPACAQIRRGGGIELARELAAGLAGVSRVDALHVFPLGAEAATREVAAEFRVTRGINSRRR